MHLPQPVRWLSNRIRKFGVLFKLSFGLLLISLPLVATILYANTRSATVVFRKTVNAQLDTLSQMAIHIEEIRKNILDISLFLAMDNDLNECLIPSATQLEEYEKYKAVLNTIQYIERTNRYIANIGITDTQQQRIITAYDTKMGIGSPTGYGYIDDVSSGIVEDDWSLYDTEVSDDIFNVFEKQSLIYSRLMNPKKLVSYPKRNVLSVVISTRILHDMINPGGIEDFEYVRIINPERFSFFLSGKEPAVESVLEDRVFAGESGYRITGERGKRKIVLYRRMTDGWILSTQTPYSAVMQEKKAIDRFSIVIISLSLLFSFFIILLLYSSIYIPLHMLIDHMNFVEMGRLDRLIDHSRKDDFGITFDKFNNMVRQLDKMTDQLYRQAVLRKEAELKLLHSQINPHFLYNTLDTIYWIAQQHGSEEISQLVFWLGKFYRINLSKGREFIPIRDAVDQVSSYLNIQRIRYKDKFTISMDIAETVRDVPIPNLTLQPIVENTIFHGIENSTRNCSIRIKALPRGNNCLIYVWDDGVGIPDHRLRSLRKTLSTDVDIDTGSFGLKNVHARLTILYGTNYGLRIYSRENVYTLVKIIIPMANDGSTGAANVFYDNRG